MSKVKKAFGIGGNKFLEGIDEQLNRAESLQRLEIQTIPMSSVSFAPGNPRELLDPDLIRKNLPALQLPPAAFEDSGDSDWEESYQAVVKEALGAGEEADQMMDIARFAASLKSPEGMIHPIMVWREEGTFFKITGERRYLAHVLLGAQTIRATVLEEKPQALEFRLLQHQENTQRVNFLLFEELSSLESVLEAWKEKTGERSITAVRFGKLIGKSRPVAQRFLKVITSGTPNLRKAIRDGRLNDIQKASEIATLSPEQADATLAKYIRGELTTRTDIRREKAKQGKRTRRTASQGRSKTNIINPMFVRTMRPKDARAIGKMVSLLKSPLNSEELNAQLEKLSMENPKDVGLAFQKIFDHIRDLSDSARGTKE